MKRPNLKQMVLTGALSLLSMLPAKAQEVTPRSTILNVTDQGNIHMLNGRDTLDYYGSGAYDGKTITLAGAQALRNGEVNKKLDVLGVGIDSLQNSSVAREQAAQKIEDYVNGTLPYLPAHLGNPNMVGEEKLNWLKNFYINIDMTDTITMVPGEWQCGSYSLNILANTFGVSNFENWINYPNFENTIDNYSNIPTLGVSSYTFDNVGHAYNAIFKGDNLSTIDFEDYYFFDSYTEDYPGEIYQEIEPGGKHMQGGPIKISRFGYLDGAYGIKIFGRINLIAWDMDEDYNITLNGLSPQFLTVNKHKVTLNINDMEKKEFNYQTDLDVNSEELGEVSFSTNLDLESILNTTNMANGTVTKKNIANKSYELVDTIPMYDDERGKYNYTIKRKALVELIQKSDHSDVEDITYYLPIKKDSIYQDIEVKDMEAPTDPTFPGDDQENYSTSLDLKNKINRTSSDVLDNSGGEVNITKSTNSTQVMDETINQVNFDFYTNFEYEDISENKSFYTHKTQVRDTEPVSGYLTDTYIRRESGQTPEDAIKSLIYHDEDNSALPVDTIIENTTENYYDVTLKDIAGNENYLGNVEADHPVGIDNPSDLEKACGLTPYPNPNPYGIKYFQSDFGQTEISVYDMSGRQLKQNVYNSSFGENNISYDFDFPQGVYVITMESETCKDSKKIIIDGRK